MFDDQTDFQEADLALARLRRKVAKSESLAPLAIVQAANAYMDGVGQRFQNTLDFPEAERRLVLIPQAIRRHLGID